ncbi:hypothetical protein BJX64DRAFT_115264 [Aspergillus heterothallicus]
MPLWRQSPPSSSFEFLDKLDDPRTFLRTSSLHLECGSSQSRRPAMFCPCARSYFVVECLQTERPRLVRSRLDRSPNSNSRAPLPMQIRPQSSRGSSSGNSGQREYGQGHGYGYGPVSSYGKQGPGSQVRSRPGYSRQHSSPRGILKVPTEVFPFDKYDIHPQPQSPQIRRSNDVREEVGKSADSSSSLVRNLPVSDAVRVRVYRRNRNSPQASCDGVIAEEVKFREGDTVVRREAKTDEAECPKTWDAMSTNQWDAQEAPQW